MSACASHRRTTVSVRSRSRHTSPTDLPLVRTNSTVCALNSGVNERLRRAVIMDILPGFSPTHTECPPKRGKPKKQKDVLQSFEFVRPSPAVRQGTLMGDQVQAAAAEG